MSETQGDQEKSSLEQDVKRIIALLELILEALGQIDRTASGL